MFLQLESWGSEQSVAASHNNDGRNVTRLNGAVAGHCIKNYHPPGGQQSKNIHRATPPSGLVTMIEIFVCFAGLTD